MPLRKGSSPAIISQNIREFHTGKTYAHTAAKFGPEKARKQAIAVALSTARRYGKQEGHASRGAHFADGGSIRGIPSTYQTDLGAWEPMFRAWIAKNKVPFDPNASHSDYDMRGFYRAMIDGDPRAQSSQDPNDKRLHYPDTWKTPSHETFSRDSQWATPDAPQWNEQDQLVAPSGHIVYDDKRQNQDRAFADGGDVNNSDLDPNSPIPKVTVRPRANTEQVQAQPEYSDEALDRLGQRADTGRAGPRWMAPSQSTYRKAAQGVDTAEQPQHQPGNESFSDWLAARDDAPRLPNPHADEGHPGFPVSKYTEGLLGLHGRERVHTLPEQLFVDPARKIQALEQSGAPIIDPATGEPDPRYTETSWDIAQNLAGGVRTAAALHPSLIPKGALGMHGSNFDWTQFEKDLSAVHGYGDSSGPLPGMKQHAGSWIDSSKFEKISDAKGSNPGGTYRDPDTDQRWYIKRPPTEDHIKNEILANKLYQLAGVPVPDLRHTTIKIGDKNYPAIASPIVPGQLLNKFPLGDIGEMHGLRDNFPVDAWLANWDAVGTGKDNVIVNPITMEAHRIDMGGALRYRAQGAPKGEAFGNDVSELKTMLDPKKSPDAAQVFQGAHDAEVGGDAAQRIADIKPSDLAKAINEWGPGTVNDKSDLYDKLMMRRKAVVDYYKPPSEPASNPNIHPQKNDDGNTVKITNPSNPTPVSHWDDGQKSVVVVPKQAVPAELHDIPFKSWKPPEDWVGVSGTDEDLYEPPWKNIPGKSNGSGVVIMEPDGRVWLANPTNQFGGYNTTFPKGKLDQELNMQENAIKEAYEETGLKVRIIGYVGDYERTTSKGRYYLAVREAGTPSDMGWESQAVTLSPKSDAANKLTSVDKKILDDATNEYSKAKKSDVFSWDESETSPGAQIYESAQTGQFADKPETVTAGEIKKIISNYTDMTDAAKVLKSYAAAGYSNEALEAKFALPLAKKKAVNKILWAMKNSAQDPEEAELLGQLFSNKQFPKPPANVSKAETPKAIKDYDKEVDEYYHALDEQDDHQYELAQGPNIAAAYPKENLNAPKPDSLITHKEFSKLTQEQLYDRFSHQISMVPKWADWKPSYKSYSIPKLTKINPGFAKLLGFNTEVTFYKGGLSKFEGAFMDPAKKKVEPGFFLTDNEDVARAYMKSSNAHVDKYVVRANKVGEIDWKKFTGLKGWDPDPMTKLLHQARKEGLDMVVINNISDVGSGNQTQYVLLHTNGSIRSVDANFDPVKIGHGHSHWAIPAGIAGTGLAAGAAQDEDQPMIKRAQGGTTPFHLRGYNESIGAPTSGAEPGVRHFTSPHSGMIHSQVPGRTDKISMNVKGGSYVLPASVVSGMGQGNSQAGSAILNSFFKMGPYGAATKGIGAPKVNYGKSMSPRMPTAPSIKMPKFAAGGTDEAHEKIPIVAAGGEFVIPPHVVRRLGGGNMKNGHNILDEFVKHMRKKTINDMRKERPPKK